MGHPTAIVYVDGFNLYYRALRGTPYKWLDLERLFDALLPDYDVVRIEYFTAQIRGKANPLDPSAPERQKAYLNALRTLSRVNIVLGTFLVAKSRARVRFPSGLPLPRRIRDGTWVDVWKVEEKGSDVSLGAHLVRDAALRRADLHVVVTSDSALAPTLELVTRELGRDVALCLPAGVSSRRMQRCGPKFMVWLSGGRLARSQLPAHVTIDGRDYFKPSTW